MNKHPVYQASNIFLQRNKRKVLSNVSIEIKAGELTGLIGPNSAGKSTLLDVLMKFLEAKGHVLLKGKPISNWSASAMAKTVAYMPQQHLAHWPISVYDYIALGRIPHTQLGQALKSEDEAKIEQAIDRADVRYLYARPVTELSGGELCRVSLARVLAVDAEVLLVDEPIAGLDPGHQLAVMQLLKQEADSGKTVVVVIHDLMLASRFCDSLWLMNQGKMVCSGPPDKVLTQQNLSDIYKVTVKVIETSPVEVVVPWSLTEASAQTRINTQIETNTQNSLTNFDDPTAENGETDVS